MRIALLFVLPLALAACEADYTPRPKQATYDHTTGQVIPPYPCPDWSHPTVGNYDNSNHSNFGCAVNNNLAVQLENPRDLIEGRGHRGGVADIENSVRTIERYRAGEIPESLTPQQETGAN